MKLRGATAHLTALLAFALAVVAPPTTALAQDAETNVTAPKAEQTKSGAPALGGFSATALGPNGKPDPRGYFVLELNPGEQYTGTLLVSNSTDETLRLRAYPVDGLTGATSGTVFANIDDPVQEAGQWLTPTKKLLRLGPKDSRKLRFTVQVPNDASPGDHVGGIAFQSAEPPKAEGKGQVQIKQVIRVAVAVQIKVKGPASASLKLDDMKLEAIGGTSIPSVVLKMRNDGQLLCRPELTVILYQDGKPLGKVERQLDTTLAGDTIDFPLPWPKPLDAGTYTGKAVVTGCGKTTELEREMKLGDDLAGSTTAPGLTSGDDNSGPPWWLFAIGGVLAAAIAFLIGRRGRKKDREAAAAAEAAVREAEARAAAAERAAAAKTKRRGR